MKRTINFQLVVTIIIVLLMTLGTFFLSQVTASKVSANYIPVYTTANSQDSIAFLVNQNETVYTIDTQNNWTKIYRNNNEIGWVKNTDLTTSDINTDNSATRVRANKTASVFKDQRSTDKPIDKLSLGVDYLKYYDTGTWSQIVLNNELVWVDSNSLSTIQNKQDAPTSIADRFPASDLLVATKTSQLITNPKSPQKLNDVSRGDWIVPSSSSLTNGYYFGTYIDGTNGFINANDVEYKKNVSQRIGVNATQLVGAIIAIDPGHGGTDSGAVSNNKSVEEKNVTFQTAQAIKTVLEEAGATVVFTRDDDSYILQKDRVQKAVSANADVFISIHYDSATTAGPSGTSTYYAHYEDTMLATLVEEQLSQNLPLNSSGIHVANYTVLAENSIPSILLELGYMNNNSDVSTFNTNSYRESVAASIVTALQQYFSAKNN